MKYESLFGSGCHILLVACEIEWKYLAVMDSNRTVTCQNTYVSSLCKVIYRVSHVYNIVEETLNVIHKM